MLRLVVVFSLVAGAITLAPQTVDARPAYQLVFLKHAKEVNDDKEFTKLLKEAKCYICHQGKSKKNHNSYGIHLTELLTKADMKDKEKALEAIKKVEEIHSDPKDDTSPTYGEMMKEGKLPGGSIEEAKEEPTES